MKKILISIFMFFLIISGVGAEDLKLSSGSIVEIKKISETNSRIYKESILTRSYIRNNTSNGEEILFVIEMYFNNIRKDRNIERLKELNSKTKEILIKFVEKTKLNKEEELVFNLVKNLYYRSIIELIIYGEIDL